MMFWGYICNTAEFVNYAKIRNSHNEKWVKFFAARKEFIAITSEAI